MSKWKSKIIAIVIINIILIAMFGIFKKFPIIGHMFILRSPVYIYDFINFFTYSLIHFELNHLLGNLLFFNIFAINTIDNNDNWEHLIGIIVVSAIIGAIGHVYLSPRGVCPSTGFSASAFGIMMYSMLSCRKLIRQLILLLISFFYISSNYTMIFSPFHDIAVDAHMWGIFGALIYRILYGMGKDLQNKLITYKKGW